MSDASVTKAVPIEEQSPLVEALHRRLAATGKKKNRYTQDVRPRNWHHTKSVSPGADRGHERSRSFKSIAAAMADQWGNQAAPAAEVRREDRFG